jgi:hypothetical protein
MSCSAYSSELTLCNPLQPYFHVGIFSSNLICSRHDFNSCMTVQPGAHSDFIGPLVICIWTLLYNRTSSLSLLFAFISHPIRLLTSFPCFSLYSTKSCQLKVPGTVAKRGRSLVSAGHVIWRSESVLTFTLVSVPWHLTLHWTLSPPVAHPFPPTSPSLPIEPLHQHGTDLVAAVLDFHQEYEVTAFDDLQRENSQRPETVYYKS